MLDDVIRAKIVTTNYHAFKLRERIDLSKGGRQLLQGRFGEELKTLETEGQMLQRVMPEPPSIGSRTVATSWKPRAKVTACRMPSGGDDGPAKQPAFA